MGCMKNSNSRRRISLLTLIAAVSMGLLYACSSTHGGEHGNTTVVEKTVIKNTIPFPANNLNTGTKGRPIDDINGFVNNQFIISTKLSDAELNAILKKFNKIKVIGQDSLVGTFIEIDISDLDAQKQVMDLRLETGIDDINNRPFKGKNVPVEMSAPPVLRDL